MCADNQVILATTPGSCRCPDGEYAAEKSYLKCEACDSDCQTCDGPSNSDCLICQDIDYSPSLTSGNCKCDLNQFEISKSPLECGLCHDSCLTCIGPTEYDCITCTDSSIVLGSQFGKCGCEDNQYLVDNDPLVCAFCHSDCKTCDGPEYDDCMTCTNPLISPNADIGYCVCAAGEFANDKMPLVCDSCDDSCSECSGPSYDDCIVCKDLDYSPFVSPGRCKCANNEYEISKLNLRCDLCHSSCATCVGPSQDDCVTCVDSSIVLGSQYGKCGCEENEYLISSNVLMCDACHSDCKTCTGPDFDDCTMCFDLETTPSYVPGACKCDLGQYLLTKTPLRCGICHPDCLECVGPHSNDCLSCKNTNLVITNTPSNCNCYTNQFPLFENPFYCQNCDKTCISCDNFDKCDPPALNY